MKTSVLFFIIAMLLCPIFVIGQISVPQVAPCSTGPGCRKFTTTFTQVQWLQGQTFKSFHYFWNFGDGCFTSGIFTIPDSLTQATQIIEHEYATASLHDAYIEVATLYDDKGEIGMAPVDPGVSSISNTATPEFSPSPGLDIDLIPLLNPRTGDTTTYIVSIFNSCSETLPTAYVNLTFNKDSVQIKKIFGDRLSTVLQSTIDMANNNGTIQLSYTSFPKNQRINSFVQFYFPVALNSGKKLNFSAALGIRGTGENLCFTGPTSDNDTLLAVKSHDPNIMYANQELICLGARQPDSLKYKIIFQNIGDREAYNVMVTNIIPEQLDINSIYVESPAGIQTAGGKNFSIDKNSREVKWILDKSYLKKKMPALGGKLRATGEKNYGTIITEDQTIDTIVYWIAFDRKKPLQPCGAIVNQATIVFDNNSPIITNVSSTSISCDTLCTPCDVALNTTVLDTVYISENGSVNLELPNNAHDHCSWYPSLGLDNPFASMPAASGKGVKYYTATVANGCVQVQYKIPIAMKEGGCDLWGLFLALGAAFVGFIVFLFSKKKRSNENKDQHS